MGRGVVVYLLHFDQRYKHAGHYLGSTEDLAARIERHRSGQGARLMEVIEAAGIKWECVRVWKGGRRKEKSLKRLHNSPKLCPVCCRAAGEASKKRGKR